MSGTFRHSRKEKGHAAGAKELLRTSAAQVNDLLADFDQTPDDRRRQEIREQALFEIRLYRTLAGEVLLPALRQAQNDASAFQAPQSVLEALDPLLLRVEKFPLADARGSSAWTTIRETARRTFEQFEFEALRMADALKLDDVGLGLRMMELRQEIIAEQPVKSVRTDNDTRKG